MAESADIDRTTVQADQQQQQSVEKVPTPPASHTITADLVIFNKSIFALHAACDKAARRAHQAFYHARNLFGTARTPMFSLLYGRLPFASALVGFAWIYWICAVYMLRLCVCV